MNWIVAVQVRAFVEAVLAAQEALRVAQEEGAEDTGAYIYLDLDALARTITLKTGNRFSGGDLDEVRRGHIGDWSLIWERSGEDCMPGRLRAWLLEHTRAEANTEREEREDSEPYDYNEHYWDTYPW